MGEGFIKIAEIAVLRDRKEVVRLVKRPVAQDKAAADIKSIFDSLNISHRQVYLNIPRHLVTVRFLKLPSTDAEEIRKMARIESLKHVPYGDEDIVSGCRIIERLPDGYSKVLIAVTQAETVRKELEILKAAGITVDAAALGSETLLLWYLACGAAGADSTDLIVNVGAGHIDIDIIEGEKLVFTRGVQYPAARPISTEKIIDQINLSMAAYRKESANPIVKIILTGVTSGTSELKTILGARIKIPVEIIDQMKNVTQQEGAALELAEASFAELLGLELKYDAAGINLLPAPVQEEQRLDLVKRNMTAALVVSALIIAIIFGTILKKLYDKVIYISYVDSELAKISPQVKQAKKMVKEMDIITAKIAERPLAIDIVTEVFKITPPGVTLTMMEYESNKAVSLRGTAPSLSDIFQFVTTLERSAYFDNVKVKYANKRAGQGVNIADFEITCPVAKVK
ncbi:MAG: pilus assembly protein PilM [Candidatus Omnitrophota bacterium]